MYTFLQYNTISILENDLLIYLIKDRERKEEKERE